VRHLTEIEAEDFAVMAPGTSGPLGDHVAYVWVDQPTISKVVVEARVGDGPVIRREVVVRGLAGDVSARLVAIAVAETVRAAMAPHPPPPCPAPPPPPHLSPEEQERAARTAPALILTPAAALAVLPSSTGVVAGPSLALGFRTFGASESIFTRWLAGGTRGSALRWFEIGVSGEYRLWPARSFRIALGAQAAFASANVADAATVDGHADEAATWSARAGGLLSFEARLAAPLWLALGIEPGAILRPVRYTLASPSSSSAIEGAWLGFSLALHVEHARLSAR